MLLCAVQRAETKQGRDSLSKVTERFQYIDGVVRNNARRLKFWRVYRAALRMGRSR
jgi:hypothetical protein